MHYFTRAPYCSAGALLLLSATAAQPSADAAVRKGASPTAKAKPAGPGSSIIPLPLNQVIPAGKRVCSAKTPSGLGYTILRQGTGAKPTATSNVTINYIGYLSATGVVFDQNMKTEMSLGQVIPGFSEGARLVALNGVVRICLPASLGYGAKATGPIPANSDLVFQVELLSIQP